MRRACPPGPVLHVARGQFRMSFGDFFSSLLEQASQAAAPGAPRRVWQRFTVLGREVVEGKIR
jgi:hypothetical protein